MKEGYEFAVIKIKGQSFMLHQIRKMVGTVIAIVRGYAGEDLIELTRTAFRVDIPQAPALGLMLEQLHYDKYDRKFGKDGVHKPIQWPELVDEMEKFKHEYIFSNIVQKEIKEKW
jgi:tRNA pseudouridine38-40 synthase